MLRTKICDLLQIDLPILAAGMGGVALSALAAAVSEAGGFGTIATAGLGANLVAEEIAAARRLTKKPFGAGVLIPLLAPEVFDCVIKERPAAIIFFWGDISPYAPACRKAGIKMICQTGSIDEAAAAAHAGAAAIIAQGFEAGGHVRGKVPGFALIPAIRDAIDDLPLIATGGIVDGRGLVAALALGADAAMFGTRFIASEEAAVHRVYKEKIVSARSGDAMYTNLFDIGWPGAAHRVLPNSTTQMWERAGHPESGNRPNEGEVLGVSTRAGFDAPLVRYSVSPPTEFIEGNAEAMTLYAGEAAGAVKEILPAAEIVRRIANEAQETIAGRIRGVLG